MSRKNEDFDEYCDPDNPRLIKYEDVLDAAGRLKNVIVRTPCIPSKFQQSFTINLFYKLENLHKSGSFKERGTLNALQLLPTDKKKLGVAIASLGNEALGFCYHANKLNVPVFVVMPFTVHISTMQKLHSMNAKVIIQGANLMDSQKYARALARDRGLTYINGRDHPHILAGYGTVALEIIDQLPCVDAIILPVGTGGLAGAVATVVKKAKPNCLVYGVQPELNAGFVKSLEMESPTMTSLQPTLADSIAVPNVGCNSFANAAPLLDKMLLVTEDWIAKSMLHYWEQERYVIEGAGACPLAAIVGHLVPELKLKNVVCICTGGNVDMTMYSRCLTKGFAVEGRLVKFTININDSTSAKSRVLDLLAEGGYNVISAFQNREWMESDTYTIEMRLVVEAKNLEHALELKRSLDRAYTGKIVFETEPFNDKRTCPCYVRKKDCEK